MQGIWRSGLHLSHPIPGRDLFFEYGGLFINVIQYNVRIFFCGGLRRQEIEHFILKKIAPQANTKENPNVVLNYAYKKAAIFKKGSPSRDGAREAVGRTPDPLHSYI